MIQALLLIASIASAQSSGTFSASLDDQIKVSNLGKAVRDLESGRYKQTGKPTFLGGICFADGTCQTTGSGSSGASLTSTQTFSGANTFTSSVTIGPSSNSLVLNFSKVILGNWSLLASTHPAGTATISFTNIISTQVYPGGIGMMKYRVEYNLNQNTSGGTHAIRINSDSTASRHVYNYFLKGNGDASVGNTATTSCPLSYTGITAVGESSEGVVYLTPGINSNLKVNVRGHVITNLNSESPTTNPLQIILACKYAGTPFLSFDLLTSAGTFTGDIAVFGLLIP